MIDLGPDDKDLGHGPQDHPHVELERISAEPLEMNEGFGVHQHHVVIAGDLVEQLFDPPRIGAVGHAHIDDEAAQCVAAGVVGDRVRHQIGIGHDDFGPVEGLDPGGAHRDVAHRAVLAVHLDPVAFRDRPFDQQDDARDEVLHDVLQAETDPDRKRTGDHRQSGQVDARRRNRDDRRQEDAQIARARHDGGLPPLVELGLRQNRSPQAALQKPRQHVTDGEDDREGQEVGRRDPRLAQREPGLEPRPKLGQVGDAGAPDERQNRKRHEGQNRAGQNRQQTLAFVERHTFEKVIGVAEEALTDQQEGKEAQRQDRRKDQRFGKVVIPDG